MANNYPSETTIVFNLFIYKVTDDANLHVQKLKRIDYISTVNIP